MDREEFEGCHSLMSERYPLLTAFLDHLVVENEISKEQYENILKQESKRKIVDNLKPCPCCGSTRIHVVAPDDGCYCWDCGLTMPNRPNWRERWNTRYLNGMPITTCNIHPRDEE